jgi:hypothetical protein
LDASSCKSCSPGEAAAASAAWHYHLASQHLSGSSSHHLTSPASLSHAMPPPSSLHRLVFAEPSAEEPPRQHARAQERWNLQNGSELLRCETNSTNPADYFSPPNSSPNSDLALPLPAEYATKFTGDSFNVPPEPGGQMYGEEGGSKGHMVSWQWMGAMDREGLKKAAEATVLFASPPPQLHRDYETLSDWV